MTEIKRRQIGKRALNPLWIIALFLSLVETVLGVAATQTGGGIQVALTAFAIGFPVLIAGAFFAILWDRPHVLYPPTEFGKGTDVTTFVNAMRRKPLEKQTLYTDMQNIIRDTLTSEQMRAALSDAVASSSQQIVEDRIRQVLNGAVNQTVEKIREVGFLTLDSRPLLGNKGNVWRVPYDQYGSVSALLDDIWFSIGTLPAFTYRTNWILRDPTSNSLFENMGTKWAEERGMETDSRSLEEVGIIPGMILEIAAPTTINLKK
jgi:hypothetical protein